VTLPVLVVTGFLGAGKTTFINQLLSQAAGRSIAAIVNDFGAINIDADLVAERSDTVLSLSNGCICCSLQGDLLRTLKLLLDRTEPINHVVIEASGIADPRGIIEALTDPVLWGNVSLDAVLTVVDAEDCVAVTARMDDPLWRAQVVSADLILVTRTDVVDPARVLLQLGAITRAPQLVPDEGSLPIDLLLGFGGSHVPHISVSRVTAARFAAVEIVNPAAASLPAFQSAMEALAPCLLRAKGILHFKEMPGRAFLFQMVGRRATIVPFSEAEAGCRLVLIGERASFDPDAARDSLAALWQA
jgi:G3E family GTPase